MGKSVAKLSITHRGQPREYTVRLRIGVRNRSTRLFLHDFVTPISPSGHHTSVLTAVNGIYSSVLASLPPSPSPRQHLLCVDVYRPGGYQEQTSETFTGQKYFGEIGRVTGLS